MAYFKRALLLGSAMAICGMQQGRADTPAPANQLTKLAQNDAPQKRSSGIEEVVVTATKTRSNVQKVAAAVTALSGRTLMQKGVSNLRDVQAEVPAARFQLEGNSVQVFLRGVGSNLDFGNVDELVGFNVNGVILPREGTSVPLFDVASLESLPGPQGTLYGRGSLGGALNMNFNRPTHDWSTQELLEVGNYGMVHFTGVTNMPVQPDLAVRVAIDTANHSGYVTDGSDSQQDLSGRVEVLYDPTPDLTVLAWGYGVDRLGNPPNLVNKGFDPITGQYSENAFLNSNPYDNSRLGALEVFAPFGQPHPEKQVFHNYVTGGQVDYHLGDITFTYIPSYFYLDSENRYYLGDIDSHKLDFYSQYTQELRASGTFGRLKFLGGLYWYNEHGRSYYFLPQVDVIDSDITHNVKSGEAAYGQLTYSVTDRLRLTGGARISFDHRDAAGVSDLGGPYTFSHDFHNIDWKAAGEYDIMEQVLGYVAAQTSYQPGTFNEAPNTASFNNFVKPAHLLAFSAGLKTRFFDNVLQVNDEAFYYIYKDLLIQSFDQNALFNPIFNATKVTIPGDEFDVILKPDPYDQANFSIAYNHARSVNFIVPETGQNFDGYQTPYSSDWTVTFGAQHDFLFPDHGFLRARVDTRFESSYYADYAHHPGTRQDGYDKTDLALTYFSESGHWTLGAWVKNIGNVAVIAATAYGGIPGPSTAYLEDPRTYGLRATFSF